MIKNKENCYGLLDSANISPPHYSQEKHCVMTSTSIPLPQDVSTWLYIWNCHPEYLKAAGKIRDCLLFKNNGPSGWEAKFKIKDLTLKKELTCPIDGSAGVVEYYAIERKPTDYQGILRDICDGKKHHIKEDYLQKNTAANEKAAEAHYLEMAANKAGNAANAGNFGRANYEYKCHEYKIDCIKDIITEDIKVPGWIWGCNDVVIDHIEL